MDKKRKFNMGIRKYTQTIFGVVLVISLIATVGYAEEINDLIPYIINVESGGNAQAVGKDGEIGLMQISPMVFKEYCREEIGDEIGEFAHRTFPKLHKKELNIKVGTWYLNRLKSHYLKDHYTIYTLLASYNWGIGNVKKVNYNPKRFPRSVKRYINKVLTIWNKAHPLDRKELLR